MENSRERKRRVKKSEERNSEKGERQASSTEKEKTNIKKVQNLGKNRVK